MAHSLLAALAVVVTLSAAAGCGGPVECGQLQYTSCAELAEARQRASDVVRARDLDECFAQRCAVDEEPAGEVQ